MSTPVRLDNETVKIIKTHILWIDKKKTARLLLEDEKKFRSLEKWIVGFSHTMG